VCQPVLRSVKGEASRGFDITPLLRQSEDQFAYEVIARGLDRSADGNRFLDTLLFSLMAGQAAIYAIVLDKIREYVPSQWKLLLVAFVLTVAGAALSVFVREGPDPQGFVTDFPDDPEGTRAKYIDAYVPKIKLNDQLRIVKALMLMLSIALTIVFVLVATAGRAGSA
jgi:hypothetical protein